MGWIADVEFRPSALHGMGTFARSPIRAGTKVWTFDPTMQVCDEAALRRLTRAQLRFALHGGYLHHPSDRFVWYADGMEYVNHASGAAANIGITAWTPLEEDNCTALRDIAAGEELLEDYAFWSLADLGSGHWLPPLYRDFCPQHYAFLQSIERAQVPA